MLDRIFFYSIFPSFLRNELELRAIFVKRYLGRNVERRILEAF